MRDRLGTSRVVVPFETYTLPLVLMARVLYTKIRIPPNYQSTFRTFQKSTPLLSYQRENLFPSILFRIMFPFTDLHPHLVFSTSAKIKLTDGTYIDEVKSCRADFDRNFGGRVLICRGCGNKPMEALVRDPCLLVVSYSSAVR